MTQRLKISGAVLALVATASVSGAQAANQKACLSQLEANSMVTLVMPTILTSLEDKCRAVLPKNSSLSSLGLDMANRMKPDSERAWPMAKVAFNKMSGKPMPAFLGDNILRPLIEAAVVAGISEEIKPESCPVVDRFVNVLAPLPAENLSGLITLLMEIGMKGKGDSPDAKGGSPFNICPAQG